MRKTFITMAAVVASIVLAACSTTPSENAGQLPSPAPSFSPDTSLEPKDRLIEILQKEGFTLSDSQESPLNTQRLDSIAESICGPISDGTEPLAAYETRSVNSLRYGLSISAEEAKTFFYAVLYSYCPEQVDIQRLPVDASPTAPA